jgi:hypothetical protein
VRLVSTSWWPVKTLGYEKTWNVEDRKPSTQLVGQLQQFGTLAATMRDIEAPPSNSCTFHFFTSPLPTPGDERNQFSRHRSFPVVIIAGSSDASQRYTLPTNDQHLPISVPAVWARLPTQSTQIAGLIFGNGLTAGAPEVARSS